MSGATRPSPAQRVRMFGPHPDNQGGIASVERLILRQPPPGIDLNFTATHRQGSALRKGAAFLAALVVAVLRTGRRDVAHLHIAPRASALRKAFLTDVLRAGGTPVVLHAHGAEFAEYYAAAPPLLRAWIGHALRRCDRLVVLSEYWRAYYRDEVGVLPERIEVLPNPVRLPDAPPPRRERPVRFVFLGRFGKRKGALDLVEAFASLPEEVKKHARLDLAGDGDIDGIRAAVRRHQLEPRVRVHEWLAPDERDALLAQSHAFVLPSRNEGLPMALLEAMSWRLAAITTPVGGIPEVVRDGVEGRLVAPGDVPGLAAALREAVVNDEGRVAYAEAARHAVEPFGLEAYAQRFATLYRALARNPVETP